MPVRSPERQQFLEDVISIAVEGGIGYWSVCTHYQWVDRFDDHKLMVVVRDSSVERDDTYACVWELDDEGEPIEGGDPIDIDVDFIAKGISRIMNDETLCSKTTRQTIIDAYREKDAGEIDAWVADSIVQIAAFGKLVYG